MEKLDQGIEVCQDDLVLLTTECLNVHLHKTDPVLHIHPVSSVWLRAQGLRQVKVQERLLEKNGHYFKF